MPAERVTNNSPWHFVLVLDDSRSMTGAPANMLNDALDTMIEEMKLFGIWCRKPWLKLSIITFGSSVRLIAEAESERMVDKTMITRFSGNSGGSDMAAALTEAAAVLKLNPGNPTDFNSRVILLTTGYPDNERAALNAAQLIHDMEVAAGKPRLIAIGLGDGANMEFLQKVASNPELAKHLQKPENLSRVLPMTDEKFWYVRRRGTQGVDSLLVDTAIIDL